MYIRLSRNHIFSDNSLVVSTLLYTTVRMSPGNLFLLESSCSLAIALIYGPFLTFVFPLHGLNHARVDESVKYGT